MARFGRNRRNRTVLPEQRVPDASKCKGTDYGVAFSFWDNRVSGSVKRYKSQSIQEGGQGLVENVFVNPNNDVMASFDYYFRQAGVTTFSASDPIRSIDELRGIYFSGANGYLSDRVSTGTEVELLANPTRNWSVRANYAYTDRKRTNVLEEGVGWWAERVALWKRLDPLYTARTGRPSIYNQLLYSRNDALRTDQFRLVEWTVPGTDFVEHELYDEANDPDENVNLAHRLEHRARVKELANHLHAGWRAALPVTR